MQEYDKEFSSPLSGTFFNHGIQKRFAGLTPSFRPLYRGLFSIPKKICSLKCVGLVFVPFIGDFFQSITRIRQGDGRKVFVPFIGDFFQSVDGAGDVVKRQTVFVPFIGDFFQSVERSIEISKFAESFRPLYRGLFSIWLSKNQVLWGMLKVFVPFIGDFFQSACLRSPSPSALASAFAAGMRGSLHQALSFRDEIPIFPGRAGIGGDLQ